MKRLTLVGFSFTSGALAALGHAPFGFWPAALAGFAALAWLVARGGRPALAGWAGGTGYFAVALHWIVEPFLVDAAIHGWMAPFALVLLAGGLALFWGLAGRLSARIGGNRALNWALCLAAAELARGHVLTGFPWALPGYIWADTDIRMLAALVGPYGLSLLTLGLTSLAVMAPGLPRVRDVILACAGGLALWLGGSQLGGEAGASGPVVRLVQPNAPQNEKWDPQKAHGFVERALDFTAAPKEGVALILWPETAIPYPLAPPAPVLARIASVSGGVPVLTGINRREDGAWFNSSVLVDGAGEIVETYDKVHLVPFGEYIPLKIDFIRALAASSGFGFTAGSGVRMIDTPLGRTVPLICYEAIFPRHLGGLGARPDYLLQITNDAWFGTFSGPYQHLDQARFRAVEMGVPLVRAANTGVSAVIDARGRVVQSLGLGQAGFIDAALPGALPPTPYWRTGDWPVGVILLITIAALFAGGRRNTIAKRPTSA